MQISKYQNVKISNDQMIKFRISMFPFFLFLEFEIFPKFQYPDISSFWNHKTMHFLNASFSMYFETEKR